MSAPLSTFAPEWAARIEILATDVDGTLTRAGRFEGPLLTRLAALAEADIAVVLVTGRSAGWCGALAQYLPVAAVIAENGAGWYGPEAEARWRPLVALGPLADHRARLGACFARLQQTTPGLEPSADNGFRLSDWTFANANYDRPTLDRMASICKEEGFALIWSAVQVHIKPVGCDKATAVAAVTRTLRPGLGADALITVGDSPNDSPLFDPQRFPLSVGVANLALHLEALDHRPRFLCSRAEFDGFDELAELLLAARTMESKLL